MANETSLVLMIVLPFVGSVLATAVPSNGRNREFWLAGSAALAVLVLAAACYPAISAGAVIRARFEWVPSLGLDFTLRMDGFAWLFSMLVSAIGFLVVLYARYYMSPEDPVPRFYSYFLSFMGAMLGVVLAGNLILIVVFVTLLLKLARRFVRNVT